MASNTQPNIDEHSLITAQLIRAHAPALKEPVDVGELKQRTAQLAMVLDLALQGFEKHEPAASIVHRLAGRLHLLRKEASPAVWQELIPLAQGHRVAKYLMQDPFTRWSLEKPRGYSCDATLIDIYS